MHIETSPRLFAVEVGDAFADLTATTDDERQGAQRVAIMVGTHLADRGWPGCWDRIEMPELLPLMRASDPDNASRDRFTLVFMLGFLHLEGLLASSVFAGYLDEIEADTFGRELEQAIGMLRHGIAVAS